MKKPKTLTPDVLIGLLTKDADFQILIEATVQGKGAGMSINIIVGDDNYVVDTFRELEATMNIVIDMVEQMREVMNKGGVRKKFVARNIVTGEEITLSDEEEFTEDDEDETPEKLS